LIYLQKKITDPLTADLSAYFPHYKGGKNLEAAKGFLQNRFKEIRKDNVTFHFTTATNKDNMEIVLNAIKKKLFVELMNENFMM